MDLSKLSILFLDGFERIVTQDKQTQKDKILPYMTVVYPYMGYYQVGLEDDPLSLLPHGAGCYITAPGVRHTIVHRLCPGQTQMQTRWLRFSVMYDGVLDVTGWFQPPLLVTGEKALPFIQAVDQLLALRTQPAHIQNFHKLRICGQLLEALMDLCPCAPTTGELDRVYPAIMLMKDKFHQQLTVEQMANACAMSPATFYRLFRQAAHQTPMQYLEAYRMKRVARHLLSGQETLSYIAEQCGYFDQFHLSRNFKKHYGISPREYKKQALL